MARRNKYIQLSALWRFDILLSRSSGTERTLKLDNSYDAIRSYAPHNVNLYANNTENLLATFPATSLNEFDDYECLQKIFASSVPSNVSVPKSLKNRHALTDAMYDGGVAFINNKDRFTVYSKSNRIGLSGESFYDKGIKITLPKNAICAMDFEKSAEIYEMLVNFALFANAKTYLTIAKLSGKTPDCPALSLSKIASLRQQANLLLMELEEREAAADILNNSQNNTQTKVCNNMQNSVSTETCNTAQNNTPAEASANMTHKIAKAVTEINANTAQEENEK